MSVTLRKFEKSDIPKKIEWINNPANNRFLHYELPLEYDKTLRWFEKNQYREDRYDTVVEVDGVPVGLIGLLSIDRNNGTAEYYISMGETDYMRRGIAYRASRMLLDHAFDTLQLNRVYLYTEVENRDAQRLFACLGFVPEALLENNVLSHGVYVDRYRYGMTRGAYVSTNDPTPVRLLDVCSGNRIYIKRDDLLPFSFGGNKARKAALFAEEVERLHSDCVVTYGSAGSNHCRVIANLCAQKGLDCHIISPDGADVPTFTRLLMKRFGAHITAVPVEAVHDTIENTLAALREQGKNPYFIPGGGHGNIGTHAYRQCYEEIKQFEKKHNLFFDYIFFASGTGTTQAGLVCGQLIHRDERQIIGISIARKCPYGREVVLQSIRDYLPAATEESVERHTHFIDDYVSGGYGAADDAVAATIDRALAAYGVPLDMTYTGKAFCGMEAYLKDRGVSGKNILFIHTGGMPLFFDYLKGPM